MERTTHSATAVLTVRVPINAAGSLVDGATGVVERIETVETVSDPQVRGIEPSLNDTTVELRARLELTVGERGEDTALVRRRLETGVGILTVERVEALEPSTESVTVNEK